MMQIGFCEADAEVKFAMEDDYQRPKSVKGESNWYRPDTGGELWCLYCLLEVPPHWVQMSLNQPLYPHFAVTGGGLPGEK